MKFGGVDVKFQDITRVANMKNARHFAHHVVPHVVRPAQILWNQAIGAVFMLLALLFLGNSYRYYKSPNTVALVFSLFFGAVMLFFGIGSFLKARRIARR